MQAQARSRPTTATVPALLPPPPPNSRKLDRPPAEVLDERIARVLKAPGRYIFASTLATLVPRHYRSILRWVEWGFVKPDQYVSYTVEDPETKVTTVKVIGIFDKFVVVKDLPRLRSRKQLLLFMAARRARGETEIE